MLFLKSGGMARYIDRNIKGISIQPVMIRDIQKAPDKIKECARIAGEIITHLKRMGMRGGLISAVGWKGGLPKMLDEAKL